MIPCILSNVIFGQDAFAKLDIAIGTTLGIMKDMMLSCGGAMLRTFARHVLVNFNSSFKVRLF